MNISDLINLELYKINKLSLNAKKSSFMIFHMPNKHITLPILQICNTNIVKVNEFNFFGLTLDTILYWKRHSNNTSNKMSRTIGVLNKLTKCFAATHKNYYIQYPYITTFKLLYSVLGF